MGLESGSYIDDLVPTNPTSADKRRFGDDHLRLIKQILLNTFPNFTGALTPTQDELNFMDGVTSSVQGQLDARLTLTDAPGDGLFQSGGTLHVGSGVGIVAGDNDVGISLVSLATIEGNEINPAEDGYLVNDNGIPSLMEHTDAGFVVVEETTNARTLETADINTYIDCTNPDSSPVLITLNAGGGKRGNTILLEQGGPGQVQVIGTATLNNANGVNTSRQFSVIALVCKGSSIWTVSGDTA